MSVPKLDLTNLEHLVKYEELVEGMPKCDFSIALKMLKQGDRCARKGWNGLGQWIELQVPDENSKMSLPYFFIRTVQGDRVPWLASQTDLLAIDWYPVPDFVE